MTRRRLLVPIVAIATFVALASGGAAAAAWLASASVTANASSATVATTLTQAGSLTTTYRYAGTTSPTARGTLAIANTGRAPLTYTLANQLTGSSALAQKTTLQLWTGTCGPTPPSTGVVTTTLADPAPALPSAARTITPGATVTVCLATRISGTDASAANAALQGQSLTAVFRVTGAVGSDWTATADAAPFTQAAYRIDPAGAVACAGGRWGEVTLNWTAPANRVAGSPVTYRIFDTASGDTLDTVIADAATASVTLGGYDLPRNGTFALAVEARDATSGTTATATAPVSVIRTTPWNLGILFPSLRCS
ncbi:hypothetical protein F6B41_02420 [Microbacterium lushaniae]|nr:hypothetical protein F6B41_22300 [Microbacterium lushaniae]KAA9159007.1 hypothetical protein F6B41_02420 [Microbacterium lushaniae]